MVAESALGPGPESPGGVAAVLPLHFAECFFIVVQSRKATPQLGHEWGVLPVCRVLCSLRREDDENLNGQSWHLERKISKDVRLELFLSS